MSDVSHLYLKGRAWASSFTPDKVVVVVGAHLRACPACGNPFAAGWPDLVIGPEHVAARTRCCDTGFAVVCFPFPDVVRKHARWR